MDRSSLSLFKESSIAAAELKSLIMAEYPQFQAIKESGRFVAQFAIMEKTHDLAEELSIISMPYKCVFVEAKNIIRLLMEYPDIVNDFLLMKMRRMKELYLDPVNDIERDYALANARFIKAVVEKQPSAMKICALLQCYIDIFGAPKPTILLSHIIKFKISENLLTENDFRNHMEAIERVSYRHGFVKRRLLTEKERASGHYHGSRKWVYPSDDEIKKHLQKQIGHGVASEEKREPLNYELNTL